VERIPPGMKCVEGFGGGGKTRPNTVKTNKGNYRDRYLGTGKGSTATKQTIGRLETGVWGTKGPWGKKKKLFSFFHKRPWFFREEGKTGE